MTLLLDTHAYLWFNADDPHLSARAAELIESPYQSPAVSIASFWEVTIKVAIGKLKIDTTLEAFMASAPAQDITVVPIRPEHLLVYSPLKSHHRDPFDRILVAQSIVEKIPIISSDASLDLYGIQRIW